jgi:AbrB family looped-hinge helix DNA binding protein
MAQQTSKITSKAQTTVPKDVREALGLRPGDELEWKRDKAGFRVRKAPARSRIDRWVGVLADIDEDVDELIERMRGR